MVVNVPKTKAMFIASRIAANKILENRPNLKLSGETINISTNEKLLGVHIDNTLSWTVHVEFTIKNATRFYIYSTGLSTTYLYLPENFSLMHTFYRILITAAQFGVISILL